MIFHNVLAIDTSLAPGGVAARGSADRVAERVLPEAGEHARLLAAAVSRVAADAGWPLAATEVVVVVTGPGSFTGLRVGVATAKAIAKAMRHEPSIDWLLKNQKKVGHYFHDLAKSGDL